MGSGGVTIVVLSSVICLKELFSDGLRRALFLYLSRIGFLRIFKDKINSEAER